MLNILRLNPALLYALIDGLCLAALAMTIRYANTGSIAIWRLFTSIIFVTLGLTILFGVVFA